MSTERMQDRLAFHRENPAPGIDEYVHDQHRNWGRSIIARRRLYLDTCLWIRLREVHLGRQQDPEMSSLLSALRARVSAHEIVCPISENTFHEILRQEDPSTRTATAELVDELSEGACLIPLVDRLEYEMRYWTLTYLGYVNPHGQDCNVWTKLSWAFGVEIPYETGIDATDELAVQKAFFDHMWSLPLVDAVDTIVKNTPANAAFDEKAQFDAMAVQINQSNAAHADDFRSFQALYRSEFLGAIETLVPTAARVLREDRANPSARHRQVRRESYGDVEKHFSSVLFQEAKNPDLRKVLRTAHIQSMCFSAVRWEKRELDGNWLHDFQHATAAIAYCDYFLTTDRGLADLLRKGNLRLYEDFPCRVISSPAELIQELSVGR